MSEKDPKTDQLIGFTNNIYPISYLKVNNLSDYRTAYGVPDALFWSPEITSTVEVAGLGQVVHDDQIDSVVPAGTVQQDGYSWQSNGSLAPYLTATDPSAVAEESTWDFRSGIAFGIAVGAGVALVQELPDAIQPSRRWRKRRLKRS
jgi:PPE-repeat protein